jgi:hypothetical protein
VLYVPEKSVGGKFMATELSANASTLNVATAEYTVNPKRQWLGLLVSGFLITNFGCGSIAMLTSSDGLVGVLFFLPLALLSGLWLRSLLRNRDLRVQLLPDGLAMTKRGETISFQWADVTEVSQSIVKQYVNGAYIATHHTYTVRLADQSKHTFNDSLRNIEELGSIIQREAGRHILLRVTQAYEAGQTVPFGPLNLSQSGIAKGNKSLPWNQVSGVDFDKGQLIIYVQKDSYTITDFILSKGKGKKWIALPIANIPNALVFAAVVNDIVDQMAQVQQSA